MCIDVQNEVMIGFVDAPAHIPGRPHISTIHRWRLRGIRGIRLESVLIGAKRFTSAEAIHRFIEATTAAADGVLPQQQAAGKASATARERRLAMADAELDAAGL